MARVELVIGVVGFISEAVLKNSPFPSSWFFPEKNLFRKKNEKMQLVYSATLVSQTVVVTEDSYNFFTFYLLQLYNLIISLEIKFF